ncbi:uncharacterized protein EMH_0072090 [Eimeria mitis]|uniref:Uncharacterized protein n=1 Tax=Eimeria mitis TaxID=44415 RepID=U6K776_9EIME|nr:uncharacterized protein EMH_0072090 [Eimeria mitis]CDJ32062.1 hypothetical protein EMH_0072090 [Eimeria mitis]
MALLSAGGQPWLLLQLLLLLLFVGLVGKSGAQLRVQSPKRLLDKLVSIQAISEENFYTIIGSTASFGTPAYGTTLRGRAFYTPHERREEADMTETGLHCDTSYCTRLKDDIDDWKSTAEQGGLAKLAAVQQQQFEQQELQQQQQQVHLFYSRVVCSLLRQVVLVVDRGLDPGDDTPQHHHE